MFKWFSDIKQAAVRLASSLNSLADQVDEARDMLAERVPARDVTPALEDKGGEEEDPLALAKATTNGRKRIKS